MSSFQFRVDYLVKIPSLAWHGRYDLLSICQPPLNVTAFIDLSYSMNSPTQSTSPHQDSAVAFKKRKIERACDSCRRKKTKCDGPKMADGICTNCIQTQKSCTYVYVPWSATACKHSLTVALLQRIFQTSWAIESVSHG